MNTEPKPVTIATSDYLTKLQRIEIAEAFLTYAVRMRLKRSVDLWLDGAFDGAAHVSAGQSLN